MAQPGSLLGEGSSPRIRGECARFRGPSDLHGIIPANTGRIWLNAVLTRTRGDHPREYGENEWEDSGNQLPLGSSPRIRGESG